MSEQSPWGTPPPNQSGGSTPGGPASPPGPPSGPPAGPPGYGPPGYGPGPGSWGPPPGPPRRRTGLIAGLISGLVLLAVVAVVVTVLATRGSDQDPETTTPTTPAPSSTSSTSSQAPTDGSTIAGTGYTIALPGPGWQDATADKEDLGSGIDVAIILGSSFDTAQSNILTEALPAPPGADVESLRGIFVRNLVGTDGATTEAVDDSELDGERAVGYRIERTNTAGVAIVQIAYLAVHDDQQYSAVVTYPATGDSVSEPDFETVIDSWTWAD